MEADDLSSQLRQFAWELDPADHRPTTIDDLKLLRAAADEIERLNRLLDELAARTSRAHDHIDAMYRTASDASLLDESRRLRHKAEGIWLVKSYVDETITEARGG